MYIRLSGVSLPSDVGDQTALGRRAAPVTPLDAEQQEDCLKLSVLLLGQECLTTSPCSVSMWVTEELVPILSSLQARGGVHPGQRDIEDEQPCTHPFTPQGNLERPINLFGVWEEAGVPGENPLMHGENMQTPCRKTPGREHNPGPSRCKATVLPTAPSCSL
ncbi:hypothetical protein AMECASPLE_011974 [Ameca splendens]|uniref:Uncharacterized protein n=1 Tax=Ameca splendens TaxID=208324 RepID=A0ABV0Z9U8_9TELE